MMDNPSHRLSTIIYDGQSISWIVQTFFGWTIPTLRFLKNPRKTFRGGVDRGVDKKAADFWTHVADVHLGLWLTNNGYMRFPGSHDVKINIILLTDTAMHLPHTFEPEPSEAR